MPPKMRLRPASSAAARKELNDRVTPGTPSEVTVKRTPSASQKSASTAAAAPLNVLWPDVYDGKGGVSSSGDHSLSASVSGLPSASAWRIAWTGRHRPYLNLQSQQTMAASARARFRRA